MTDDHTSADPQGPDLPRPVVDEAWTHDLGVALRLEERRRAVRTRPAGLWFRVAVSVGLGVGLLAAALAIA